MLALRCALLTALLAAPGAALAPGGCPAPGKSFARTWRVGGAGRGKGGGAPFSWRRSSPRAPAPRPPAARAPRGVLCLWPRAPPDCPLTRTWRVLGTPRPEPPALRPHGVGVGESAARESCVPAPLSPSASGAASPALPPSAPAAKGLVPLPALAWADTGASKPCAPALGV